MLGRDRNATPDAVFVGVYHALWQAGGAGCVHDVEHVVVTGAHGRFSGIGGIPEGAVVAGEIGALAARHLQPLDDVRLVAAAMQIRHRIHEVVVEDQPRGATVLQDELQFVGPPAANSAARPRRRSWPMRSRPRRTRSCSSRAVPHVRPFAMPAARNALAVRLQRWFSASKVSRSPSSPTYASRCGVRKVRLVSHQPMLLSMLAPLG